MEQYIINMSREGISGVGVRREGGGNGEVRRGRRGVQVKTDNTQGSQAVNLQGLAPPLPTPPVMPAETLTGLAKDCAKLCCWPEAFLSDKRQWGAELFPWHPSPSLRSLITYETDITFLKVLRIRGSQAREGYTDRGTQPSESAHRTVREAGPDSQFVFTFNSKCFLYNITTSSFSESDTK